MDIRCEKCEQKYYIPDYKLRDKPVFFHCEKCGNKIVLSGEGEGWFAYKSFSSPVLSLKDIVEGIFYAFNFKNLLFTFLLLLSYSVIGLIGYLVFRGNARFFLDWPALALFLFLIFSTVMMYLYDIHLYLISKNTFHRIRNEENIHFSHISTEISNDLKPIFFLSIFSVLVFAFLFIPVLYIGAGRIAYAGFFSGIFIAAAVIFFVTRAFRNILYAYTALKSRNLSHFFRGMFRFMRVENINLFIYLLVITAVSIVFFAGVLFFVLAGISLATVFAFGSGGAITPAGGSGLMPGIYTLQPLISSITASPFSARFGIAVFLFVLFIIALMAAAFLINLRQNLAVAAVYIMELRPGMSVSRAGVVGVTSALFLLALVLSGLYIFLK